MTGSVGLTLSDWQRSVLQIFANRKESGPCLIFSCPFPRRWVLVDPRISRPPPRGARGNGGPVWSSACGDHNGSRDHNGKNGRTDGAHFPSSSCCIARSLPPSRWCSDSTSCYDKKRAHQWIRQKSTKFPSLRSRSLRSRSGAAGEKKRAHQWIRYCPEMIFFRRLLETGSSRYVSRLPELFPRQRDHSGNTSTTWI